MDNEYKGEVLSFIDLISKYNIEIPIIQRDYAQGRKSAGEIRRNFLQALKESICENRKIMLDFIYGSVVDSLFQPLDGQQRLTTLFLLHWYAFKKDNCDDNILKKFTYETRISSRDFCAALVSCKMNFDSSIKASESIIDSSWFFLSWKKDPTIDAMLRTIDDIHSDFYDVDDLSDILKNNTLKLIQFYCVELENVGLTDDLYIKMNSRGKLLTPFENFKASFQKKISNDGWESVESIDASFSHKIDTGWTDLFWNNFRKNNKIDDSIMRFISVIAMIRQSSNRESRVEGEDRLSIINKLHENANNVKPKYFLKEDFDYLVECLELYRSKIEVIKKATLNFPFWRHEASGAFIQSVVYDEASASYTQKVLFFAQTEYFRKINEFDDEKYSDWMRVVRNIVSRGDIEKSGKRADIIRSQQTFDGVINLVSELSSGCENIIEFLSSDSQIKSAFARDQVEEEKIKSKLIVKYPGKKSTLHRLEDTDLLRGRIDFVLHCIDYDKKGGEFNLTDKMVSAFTDYFQTESEISNDLRRALLTIDVENEYDFYCYWWSSWNVIKSDKRCLIDKFRELEYFIYSDYREYFKKLILKLADGTRLTEISQKFVAPDDFPNWKLRLIKEPDLLNEKCRSHYIAIPEDNTCCYLLKSKRPRDEEGCEKIE